LIGITRWSIRYESCRDPQDELRVRLKDLAGIPVFSFRLRAGILTALAMVPLGIALEFIHVHIPGRSYQEANIVAETCGVFGGIAFALAARWVDQALERTSRTAARQ
jgi:hypothetical protein